jgi:hypothetical protein
MARCRNSKDDMFEGNLYSKAGLQDYYEHSVTGGLTNVEGATTR